MKVKELIELLQEYNPESNILIDHRNVEIIIDDCGYGDEPTINLST